MTGSGRRRTQLLTLRSTLQSELEDGASGAATVELDQTRVGRLSRMDALQAQAMSAEANRRRQLSLTRIESALKRIEDGRFGVCITCEEPIPEARLDVDPTVLKCIACAEADEN